MAWCTVAARHVRRAKAGVENACRCRSRQRVEGVHVYAGIPGHGPGHGQIQESPTIGEKPRQEMRRVLLRSVRLGHDRRWATRCRTAGDATLWASDHDDVVLVPRAADGEVGQGAQGLRRTPGDINLLELTAGVEGDEPTVGRPEHGRHDATQRDFRSEKRSSVARIQVANPQTVTPSGPAPAKTRRRPSGEMVNVDVVESLTPGEETSSFVTRRPGREARAASTSNAFGVSGIARPSRNRRRSVTLSVKSPNCRPA